MKKKASPKDNLNVELSQNEASYVQGMLAAYKQRLVMDKSSGGTLISQEIRKAQRIERKFLAT